MNNWNRKKESKNRDQEIVEKKQSENNKDRKKLES